MKQEFDLQPIRHIINIVDLDNCLCLEGHIGDYFCCYLHIINAKCEHTPTKM